ncbi:MAG: hypothetical protein QM535_21420 [Limnohabitans sp.]|nr:hypothetical protein [Limnohabitans sp.]
MKQKTMSLGSSLKRTEIKKINGGNVKVGCDTDCMLGTCCSLNHIIRCASASGCDGAEYSGCSC